MSNLSAVTTEHDPVTCEQCNRNLAVASTGGHIGGQCRPNPVWGGKAWLGVYGWYPYTSTEEDIAELSTLQGADFPSMQEMMS